MKNSDSTETNSRRQFTRSIVTAAVAAPILASISGCKGDKVPTEPTPGTSPSPGSGATTGDCPCTVTTSEGLKEVSFGAGAFGLEDHIPPMLFGGGGSLVVDSTTKLKVEGTGTGPFTYTEDGITDDDDRYGDIKGATVITETAANPFTKISSYFALLPGAQLLLWYQDISASPIGDDDATYPTVTFPDGDPDVKVIGGRAPNFFKMIIKKKALDGSKSHKPKKPNRFTHASGGLLARHFRIGQWRLVRADGSMIVGASGDENYTIFLRFGHFQP